ncbi:hypothetical protein K8T06_16415, partial [bacterium]|nr:hypothetical protein [bacterium]
KLLYCGRLYPPKRSIDPILNAFKLFLDTGGSGMFYYYGPSTVECNRSAERIGITHAVAINNSVSRAEVLSIQAKASINTVITSIQEDCDLADAGTITGKVFDYFGLRKPILVVSPRGSDIRQLIEVSGGGQCFSGSEIIKMAGFMKAVQAGNLPEFKDPEAFSWSRTVLKLDFVLKEAIAKGR